MFVEELVSVTGTRAPLSEAAAVATELGYEAVLSAGALILRKPFRRETLLPLAELRAHLQPTISGAFQTWRSVNPTYSAEDFRTAPLLLLGLPDASHARGQDTRLCPGCKRPVTCIQYESIVGSAPWRSHALTVNGCFVVFSSSLVAAFQMAGLTGADFPAFDRDGRFHYVQPRHVLGPLLNTAEDWLEYEGVCEACGRQNGKSLHAPFKYPLSSWHGEDFLYCPFSELPAFSHAAHTLILSQQRRAAPFAPILLT